MATPTEQSNPSTPKSSGGKTSLRKTVSLALSQKEEDAQQQKENLEQQQAASIGGARSLGKFSKGRGGKGGGLVRMRTTQMFGIPSGFFRSRAEIRTWGVADEDLVDPSVQPIPRETTPPQPFHVTLPGYTEEQGKSLYSKLPGFPEGTRDPALGPDLSSAKLPSTLFPTYALNPNFVQQSVGYDWADQPSYQMDKYPYVNAIFDPVDPSATNMYAQCVPWTAYAYGVPRV